MSYKCAGDRPNDTTGSAATLESAPCVASGLFWNLLFPGARLTRQNPGLEERKCCLCVLPARR